MYQPPRIPTGREHKLHEQAMQRRHKHPRMRGPNDYFWIRLAMGLGKLPLFVYRLITRRKPSS